jgi:methylenetetrahydrofolate reductase (NADPH)
VTASSHDHHSGSEHRLDLIERLTFEVVPLKSIEGAIDALPPGSEVSVTCSPVKGIPETIRLTDQVRNRGHIAIPHIAARMVEGPEHVAQIAKWMRTEGIGRLFLVGGDANPPAGPYRDAVSFLRDLLDAGPELHTVGVTAYPDGHAAIDDRALSSALHAKQQVLAEAGVSGYASTQMCFDPDQIRSWLTAERQNGLTLPVHLGIAGVVDRTKLMTMGVRLGIGSSLGYLKKNRKAISSLLSRSDYNPDTLLEPLQADLQPLGVAGIHCFTFNQVAATDTWRRQVLEQAGR